MKKLVQILAMLSLMMSFNIQAAYTVEAAEREAVKIVKTYGLSDEQQQVLLADIRQSIDTMAGVGQTEFTTDDIQSYANRALIELAGPDIQQPTKAAGLSSQVSSGKKPQVSADTGSKASFPKLQEGKEYTAEDALYHAIARAQAQPHLSDYTLGFVDLNEDQRALLFADLASGFTTGFTFTPREIRKKVSEAYANPNFAKKRISTIADLQDKHLQEAAQLSETYRPYDPGNRASGVEVLEQYTADCGYNALWNAINLIQGTYDQMSDRAAFMQYLQRAKALVASEDNQLQRTAERWSKTKRDKPNLGALDNINFTEIEKIIRNEIAHGFVQPEVALRIFEIEGVNDYSLVSAIETLREKAQENNIDLQNPNKEGYALLVNLGAVGGTSSHWITIYFYSSHAGLSYIITNSLSSPAEIYRPIAEKIKYLLLDPLISTGFTAWGGIRATIENIKQNRQAITIEQRRELFVSNIKAWDGILFPLAQQKLTTTEFDTYRTNIVNITGEIFQALNLENVEHMFRQLNHILEAYFNPLLEQVAPTRLDQVASRFFTGLTHWPEFHKPTAPSEDEELQAALKASLASQAAPSKLLTQESSDEEKTLVYLKTLLKNLKGVHSEHNYEKYIRHERGGLSEKEQDVLIRTLDAHALEHAQAILQAIIHEKEQTLAAGNTTAPAEQSSSHEKPEFADYIQRNETSMRKTTGLIVQARKIIKAALIKKDLYNPEYTHQDPLEYIQIGQEILALEKTAASHFKKAASHSRAQEFDERAAEMNTVFQIREAIDSLCESIIQKASGR